MIDPDKEYYLSWKSRITGPFSVDDIHQKLRQRQISTLCKVQVNGDWQLLRTFLKDHKRKKIQQEKRAEQARIEEERQDLNQAQLAREMHQQRPLQDPYQQNTPPPIPVDHQADALDAESEIIDEQTSPVEGKGLGVASFALSLIFFVPGLNLFCFILSLIFGHLSLAQAPNSLRKDQCALPFFGVSFSYIMGSFLVLMSILILPSVPDFLGRLKGDVFLEIHVQMVGVAIVACVFACLLMWAVHMMARYVPKFYICYICSLLPLCLGQVASVIIARLSNETGTDLFLLSMAAIAITLVNALTWPCLIRDRDGYPLSHLHAAVASIFCVVFYAMVIFLFFAFISLIN